MSQNVNQIKALLGEKSLEGIKNRTIENLAEKYSVIKVLGAGGNATVFEAERCSDHKRVAVKVLRNYSTEKKARFSKEIKILRECSRKIKGVMPIYDSNEDDDGFWYEMPITESAESVVCNAEVNVNDEKRAKCRVKKSVEIVRACAIVIIQVRPILSLLLHPLLPQTWLP